MSVSPLYLAALNNSTQGIYFGSPMTWTPGENGGAVCQIFARGISGTKASIKVRVIVKESDYPSHLFTAEVPCAPVDDPMPATPILTPVFCPGLENFPGQMLRVSPQAPPSVTIEVVDSDVDGEDHVVHVLLLGGDF